MDVNDWMSQECSDEGTYTLRTFIIYLLVHIHQKEKIALEIAAKIASVNRPLSIRAFACAFAFLISI
jgi:hypothetical protein